METKQSRRAEKGGGDPYSLGILIEWKLTIQGVSVPCILGYPYSLGILIEWKHLNSQGRQLNSQYPYSLGILIEWKPFWIASLKKSLSFDPYSLGILIEWKPSLLWRSTYLAWIPTR